MPGAITSAGVDASPPDAASGDAARRPTSPPGALPSLTIARRSNPQAAPAADPAGLQAVVSHAASGPGAALPAPLAEKFGAGLGMDVSGVRVHTDAAAARGAESLGASAFTVGDQIFFGAGQYQPGSPAGDHLIAHELAHVAQHATGELGGGGMQMTDPSDAVETAAETRAHELTSGRGAVSRMPAATTAGRGSVVARNVLPPPPKPAPPPQDEAAKGKHDGKKIGSWGSDAQWPITVTRTVGKFATEAAAAAAARSNGNGGAYDLEDGQYVAYAIDTDSWLWSFTYDNARVVRALDFTTIQSHILAIVTQDGVIVKAGKWANPSSVIKSMSPAQLLNAESPFTGYTDAHGKGLAKLTGEDEVLNAFYGALRDQAMDTLARSEAETRRQMARMAPGVKDGLSPTECAAIRKDAGVLAKIDDDYVSAYMAANPYGKGSTPISPERKKELEQQMAALKQQRRLIVAGQPLLGQVKPREVFLDPNDAKEVAGHDDAALKKRLAGDCGEVLGNIADTRENIQGKSLNLWAVKPLVDSTIAGLGITDAQRRQWIMDKCGRDAAIKKAESIAITVFSIGFGILAAFATGGASLALTAGALGLSAADAAMQTKEYLVDKAAAGTDMDPGRALVPSDLEGRTLQIALAWIAVGLDAKAVIDAARAIKVGAKVMDEATKLAKGSESLLERLKLAVGEFGADEVISGANKSAIAQKVGASIDIVPSLKGEIRVLYEVDETGRVFAKGIQCGETAKIADILLHTETVRLLNRYQGASGRILELWDRLKSFVGVGNGNPFPVGSEAFNSWHEVQKLPAFIRDRMNKLGAGSLTKDAESAVRSDLEFIEAEYARHKAIVDRAASEEASGAATKGSGYIAKGENATADAVAKGYPPLPADNARWYYYRRTEKEGVFEFCTIEKAPSDVKRYYVAEEGGQKVLKEGRKRPVLTYFDAAHVEEAFTHLTTQSPSFEPYWKAMQEAGVTKEEVIGKLKALLQNAELPDEILRHELKELGQPRILAWVKNKDRLAAKYSGDALWKTDPDRALRKYSQKELMDTTAKLDNKDASRLEELWVSDPKINPNMEGALEKQTGIQIGNELRVPDNILKNGDILDVKGGASLYDWAQIDAFLGRIGKETTTVSGHTFTPRKVTIMAMNGEGVATNAAEMQSRLGKGLQVEIWNSAGDSKLVTAANAADLEGDMLKNFLHPPAKK